MAELMPFAPGSIIGVIGCPRHVLEKNNDNPPPESGRAIFSLKKSMVLAADKGN
jgi:hypothetical protein